MHKVKATNTHNNWAVGHRRARLKHLTMITGTTNTTVTTIKVMI